MKIITYCKTLELDECQEINFHYGEAMVSFFIGGFVEQFYFMHPDMALKFLHELIESIYCSSPVTDLSHITTIPRTINVIPLKEEIRKRIDNHIPSDDENDK